MTTLDKKKTITDENLPHYKNNQLGVGLTRQGGGSVGKIESSGGSSGGFPDFKFQKNKSENLSRQVWCNRAALWEINNVVSEQVGHKPGCTSAEKS